MNEDIKILIGLFSGIGCALVAYGLGIRFGIDIERGRVRNVEIDADGKIHADVGVNLYRHAPRASEAKK